MRTELLNYIKATKFTNFQATDELPFNNSGMEMYIKNPKRIYVDADQTAREVFIPVLNSNIDAEVTTVRVFFSNDSKKLPSDYNQVTSFLLTAKDQVNGPEYFRREVDLTTEQIQDLLVTTVEYRFTKLI